MPEAHPFADATLISCYSRADALADGVLIDRSTIGREAGLRLPVAITRAAWEAWIGWTDDDTKRQTTQDECLSPTAPARRLPHGLNGSYVRQ
ncbi:MAG: DUF6573 family protein [Hyphomicrobiaceae bacterium]